MPRTPSRIMTVAAAQMGPIARDESRQAVVARLIDMLRQAKDRGADLVVYPELCLTTFFPRWMMEDQDEVDSWFERTMPNPAVNPLFEAAKAAEIGFCLGYAELAQEEGGTRRFNTAILVDKAGRVALKYRKVHLPGHAEPQAGRKFQHLEKRYFEPGNLGFPVKRVMDANMGLCICNDRRWPETYRVMGLQDVEMVLCGYNTPTDHVQDPAINRLSDFHNHLSMQAGAYQNATWVVGVAKGGVEEGSEMITHSAIFAPAGEIVAQAATMEDEVVTFACDLEMGRKYKETIFNFAAHREPDAYKLIVERKGAQPPAA